MNGLALLLVLYAGGSAGWVLRGVVDRERDDQVVVRMDRYRTRSNVRLLPPGDREPSA